MGSFLKPKCIDATVFLLGLIPFIALIDYPASFMNYRTNYWYAYVPTGLMAGLACWLCIWATLPMTARWTRLAGFLAVLCATAGLPFLFFDSADERFQRHFGLTDSLRPIFALLGGIALLLGARAMGGLQVVHADDLPRRPRRKVIGWALTVFVATMVIASNSMNLPDQIDRSPHALLPAACAGGAIAMFMFVFIPAWILSSGRSGLGRQFLALLAHFVFVAGHLVFYCFSAPASDVYVELLPGHLGGMGAVLVGYILFRCAGYRFARYRFSGEAEPSEVQSTVERQRLAARVSVVPIVLLLLLGGVFAAANHYYDPVAFAISADGERLSNARFARRIQQFEALDDKIVPTHKADRRGLIPPDRCGFVVPFYEGDPKNLLGQVAEFKDLYRLTIAGVPNESGRPTLDHTSLNKLSSLENLRGLEFDGVDFQSSEPELAMLPPSVGSLDFWNCRNVGNVVSGAGDDSGKFLYLTACDLSAADWEGIVEMKSLEVLTIRESASVQTDWSSGLVKPGNSTSLRRISIDELSRFIPSSSNKVAEPVPADSMTRVDLPNSTLQNLLQLNQKKTLDSFVYSGEYFSPAWKRRIESALGISCSVDLDGETSDHLLYSIYREGKSLKESLVQLADECELNADGEITSLRFRFPISDSGIAELARIESLEKLNMQDGEGVFYGKETVPSDLLTTDGFAVLAKLENLKQLRLPTWFGPLGRLDARSNLPAIGEFHVDPQRMNDEVAEKIGTIRHLHMLTFTTANFRIRFFADLINSLPMMTNIKTIRVPLSEPELATLRTRINAVRPDIEILQTEGWQAEPDFDEIDFSSTADEEAELSVE